MYFMRNIILLLMLLLVVVFVLLCSSLYKCCYIILYVPYTLYNNMIHGILLYYLHINCYYILLYYSLCIIYIIHIICTHDSTHDITHDIMFRALTSGNFIFNCSACGVPSWCGGCNVSCSVIALFRDRVAGM
jgi:hypothetical protein